MNNIQYTANYMDTVKTEKQDVSYSMYVENIRGNISDNEPLKHSLSKIQASWVDDYDIQYCQNIECNSLFTFINRKHHCRKCGKVFCSTCTNYRAEIPHYMLSDDSKKGTFADKCYNVIYNSNEHRVCKKCLCEINQLRSIKRLIKILNLIEFDMKQLKQFGKICKTWLFAANVCLSTIKNIQYKLPHNEFTVEEIYMMQINSKYFAGHNRYLTYYIKTISGNNEELDIAKSLVKQKKYISCFSMMCTSNCKEMLTAPDVIDIISSCNRNNANTINKLKFALSLLKCSDTEFRYYIPYLTYNIHDSNTIIDDFLINRCSSNFNLVNALYREINILLSMKKLLKYSRLKDSFVRHISKNLDHKNYLVELLKGDSFINTIRDISNNVNNADINNNNIDYKLNSNVILPLNTDININNILYGKDDISVKNSATQPVVIPCITADNTMYKILFKNENTRKDQIIMDIIRLIVLIVKDEENIDLDIVMYNVLPTGENDGMIEIVENCDTIYSIHQNLNSDILNYILENNDNLTIKSVRNKFIRSAAAFSVITYILGVGDRHLDNIMITKDGRLFHIDFGYVLGQDTVISNPGIRITPDIIKAIGGSNSPNYNNFKELCSIIYNCIRRNINIFYHMLMMLPSISDIDLTEDQIKEQILARFRPGENRIDAELHLVSQLEQNKITDQIKDWCHYHSKEKTISSSVSKISMIFSALMPSYTSNS